MLVSHPRQFSIRKKKELMSNIQKINTKDTLHVSRCSWLLSLRNTPKQLNKYDVKALIYKDSGPDETSDKHLKTHEGWLIIKDSTVLQISFSFCILVHYYCSLLGAFVVGSVPNTMSHSDDVIPNPLSWILKWWFKWYFCTNHKKEEA